jgi:hypothetical protein
MFVKHPFGLCRVRFNVTTIKEDCSLALVLDSCSTTCSASLHIIYDTETRAGRSTSLLQNHTITSRFIGLVGAREVALCIPALASAILSICRDPVMVVSNFISLYREAGCLRKYRMTSARISYSVASALSCDPQLTPQTRHFHLIHIKIQANRSRLTFLQPVTVSLRCLPLLCRPGDGPQHVRGRECAPNSVGRQGLSNEQRCSLELLRQGLRRENDPDWVDHCTVE